MKRIFYGLLLAMAILLVAVPVLAAYYANLTVEESDGNSYDMLALQESVDVDYLATNGYITATGLDTRVVTGSEVELPHMLVDDRILFCLDVTASQTYNLQFTTGNTALTSFPVITGDGGYVTITDHANLELGNDFEIEFKAALPTDVFPIIEDTSTSAVNTEQTSHTIDLPTDVTDGRLLILLFGCYDPDNVVPTITWPGGWTNLDKYATNHYSWGVAYKVADGESTTVTVTTATSGYSAHQVLSVSHYTGTPSVATRVDSSGANPDSGAVPSAVKGYYPLVLTMFGSWKSLIVSSYPTDYDTVGYKATTGDYMTVGSASRTIVNYSEDPGQFTLSGASSHWSAWTVTVNRGRIPLTKQDAIIAHRNEDGDFEATILSGTPKTVTATVDSAEHIYTIWADTTNLGLDIDGSTEDTEALAGQSVPGNANHFILSMPYFNYYQHTTTSTLRLTYEPVDIISGTTLLNEENPGTYDGAITFGSNPAGVDVTLGALISGFQPEPGGGGGYPDSPDMGGETGQPGWTEDIDELITNPFYPVVDAISDETDIPVPIWWVMLATFIVMVAMLLCFKYLPNQLITMFVGGGLSAFFYHMGIFPFWVIFIFVIGGIAILVAERKPVL